MFGFALFGGASLACGLAESPAALLAARAVQGLGAAAVSPAALALLTAGVPEGPRRTKALGVWTAAAAGGGALGWVLGGVLTEQAGWEWVFLVNVAPCGLGLLLASPPAPGEPRPAPRAPRYPGRAHGHRRGSPCSCSASTRAEQAGIAAASTLGLAARGRAPAGRLRAHRAARRAPAAPARARSPTAGSSGALVAAVVITAASTGPLFLVVLHLQDDLRLSRRPRRACCSRRSTSR